MEGEAEEKEKEEEKPVAPSHGLRSLLRRGSIIDVIPEEAESITVMVGGVKFLENPVTAFVRLKQVREFKKQQPLPFLIYCLFESYLFVCLFVCLFISSLITGSPHASPRLPTPSNESLISCKSLSHSCMHPTPPHPLNITLPPS